MHLTHHLSWALAALAVCPSAVVCIPDATTTNEVTKTDSGGASATSEGSSSPASSPHSSSPTDSAESTNSTVATTTTSEAPRPITTEVVVTPTTSVPNLLSKWPNGANGKEVEFITSLLGFIIAFII